VYKFVHVNSTLWRKNWNKYSSKFYAFELLRRRVEEEVEHSLMLIEDEVEIIDNVGSNRTINTDWCNCNNCATMVLNS
jgi:hypothetical protein